MSYWTHECAEVRDKAGRVSSTWAHENGKDECVVQLEGNKQLFWLGSEIGMWGGYDFHGVTFGGDGVNELGIMGDASAIRILKWSGVRVVR